MNVSDIIKNVNAECKPITNVDNFIRRQAKKAQDKIQSLGPEGGWRFLFQYDTILQVESGVKEYALNQLVDTSKFIHFFDEANRNYLTPQMRMQALVNYPQNNSSGNPYEYVFKGFWPVKKQPASAGKLDFVSSSSGDTSDINIQYINDSAIFIEETITLNGTSTVQTAGNVEKVLNLYKHEKTAGIVTVKDSSANEMVAISPKLQSVSHPVVEFYSIPTANQDIYYDFCMKLMPIYDDTDVSLLPDQYHEALELYCKAQVYKTLDKYDLGKASEQEFYDFIEIMKQDVYIPLQKMSFDRVSGDGRTYPPEYRNPTIT